MAEQRPQADKQSYELLQQFIQDLAVLYKKECHSLFDLRKKLAQFIEDSKTILAQHKQEQARPKIEEKSTMDTQQHNERKENMNQEEKPSKSASITSDLKQESDGKETVPAKTDVEGDPKLDDDEEPNSRNARVKNSRPKVEEKSTMDTQQHNERKENMNQEEKLSKSASLKDKITDYEIELELKGIEIESLRSRVASYSEKLTKQDQRHVEDTLSLNRQSQVERDYKTFVSDERIDACIIIQRKLKEKTDINARRLSCFIFETVYEYVLVVKGAMTDAFKDISNFVIAHGPGIGQYCRVQRIAHKETRGGTNKITIAIPIFEGGSEYPRDVLSSLQLCVKETAPEISTDLFITRVKEEIQLKVFHDPRNQRLYKFLLSEELLNELEDYVRACIKLTWRMITQVPPMKLEYHTFTFKQDRHKMTESQSQSHPERFVGKEIRYLWPALLDGGGRVLTLAEVIKDEFLL